ncbi:multidrug effflux MFS transporter [Microbacterium sp. bgisy207]|uniref:multidrug effflux MFS transporter n=1 Tax=Microbacterium sp. bgisy207 TaxID=3413800 RepID=UPI003EB6B080
MTSARGLSPGLIAALGFVAAVGPFATDMYLASFTDIASDLGVDAAAVQLTLTSFLVGVASGQLVLGPWSDRVGRRPVLIAGGVVFAVSSIAIVFAPTIAVFVILRFVQGFSGSAGMVLARTVAVDLSPKETAVRALSLIVVVVGVAPLIAPPIGGLLSEAVGWRGVMASLAVVAVAMLAVSLWVVPESLAPEHRHSGGMGATFRSFRSLLADRGFPLYTGAFALTFGAIMAYVSASPFVGQVVLGMSPAMYSISFAVAASGVILSNLVNARIAVRFGPRRMLVVGLGFTTGAAALLLGLTLAGALTVVGFVTCAFFLTLGLGFTMSNSSALGLARADRARGAGSAIMGTSQFVVGAIASPLVGLAGEDTAVPMAVVIAVMMALSLLLGLLALRMTRRGRR